MMFLEKKCPLCGSDNSKIIHSGYRPEKIDIKSMNCTSTDFGLFTNIKKCRECGMIFQSPVLTEESLIELYKNVEDQIYLEKNEERKLNFSQYVKLIKQYLSKSSHLLEIGSYTGVFLEMLNREGIGTAGLELSDWARQIAKETGAEVYGQPLSQLYEELKNKYDGVCLWDVIEHYIDPLKELSYMNKALKENGYLFISTLDISSFTAKILGKKYPFLMLMHTVYFSKKTLKKILNKTGFKIIKIKKHNRMVSEKYLYNRINTFLGRFSFIVKMPFFLYFRIFGKKFISIGFMGLMDVVAVKK